MNRALFWLSAGLVASLLSACGPNIAIYIDNEFKPHFEWWVDQRPDSYPTDDLKIEFTNSGKAGVCIEDGLRLTIQIDRSLWMSLSPACQRSLISHELAHCLLGSGHKASDSHFMYYQLRCFHDDDLIDQIKALTNRR